MSIVLTENTETRLRQKAEREGKELSPVAESLILAALDWEEWNFTETVAGIERGLQAAAEGRERPFEDYVAEVMQRRLARDAGHSQTRTERAA